MKAPEQVQYDGFELALLQSAHTEKAPSQALRKTAAALGVTLPTASAIGAAMMTGGSASASLAAPHVIAKAATGSTAKAQTDRIGASPLLA